MFLNKLALVLLMVVISTSTIIAQNKIDYAPYWQKVTSFEKQGLTKSALEQVMVIYKLAKKDKNEAQEIKTAMYQIKYRNMVQEDSHENNIFYVDTLIAQSNTPVKNILQNTINCTLT